MIYYNLKYNNFDIKSSRKTKRSHKKKSKRKDLHINKIKKEFEKILLDVIRIKCPHKRKHDFSDSYYLYHISLVLTDLQKWSSLKYVKTLESTAEYHYKTIQDKHIEWSKANVYHDAYYKINNKYSKNLNFKNNNDIKLRLFIDTTNIYNKYGVEYVGFGGQSRKKKHSLLSAICDDCGNIFAIVLIEPNNKEIKKINSTGEIKINKIKTFPHDSQTIEITLEIAIEENKITTEIILVGDIGYMSKDQKEIFSFIGVELIYPKKKNSIVKSIEYEKKHINKRYIIENSFNRIKKFPRIGIRYDKLKCTYMGFSYLALIMTYIL